MCAKRHKITNVPLFNTLWDIIFLREGQFRGQKSRGPLKMSREMAHKVTVPLTKIMSRSFLNSGTYITSYFLTVHYFNSFVPIAQ